MTPSPTPDAEDRRAEVVHELKTWPVYFDAVERGEKTFEVRKDDRGFQKGDLLRLRRWDPKGLHIANGWPSYYRACERRITWILTGGQFGVEPGYVVMGLAPTPDGRDPGREDGHG